jgi:hypothetical protein
VRNLLQTVRSGALNGTVISRIRCGVVWRAAACGLREAPAPHPVLGPACLPMAAARGAALCLTPEAPNAATWLQGLCIFTRPSCALARTPAVLRDEETSMSHVLTPKTTPPLQPWRVHPGGAAGQPAAGRGRGSAQPAGAVALTHPEPSCRSESQASTQALARHAPAPTPCRAPGPCPQPDESPALPPRSNGPLAAHIDPPGRPTSHPSPLLASSPTATSRRQLASS